MIPTVPIVGACTHRGAEGEGGRLEEWKLGEALLPADRLEHTRGAGHHVVTEGSTELDVEISDKKGSLRLDAVVVHARKVPPMWQRLRPSGMGLRFLQADGRDEGLRRLVGRSASLW